MTTRALLALRRLAGLVVPGVPVPAGAARRRTGVATVVVAVVAVVVSATRQPGSALDSIWAEDGNRFLGAAWHAPLWRTLTMSDAGYLHLYPRVAAQVAALVPVGDAAVVMALAGALASAIAAAAVVVATEGHLPSLPARVGLGLAVALFPSAGYELAATVANSHWYLMAAAFCLVLWTPRSSLGTAVAGAGVFAAAMGDPLTLLMAPVVLARLLSGGRGSRVVLVAFVAGIATQVPTVLGTPLQPPQPGGTPAALLHTWVMRVPAVAVGGFAPYDNPSTTVQVASVGIVASLGIVAVLVARDRARTAAVLVLCVAASVVAFVVPVGLRWRPTYERYPVAGVRYAFGPLVLVFAVGAVAADRLRERFTRGAVLFWLAWPAAVLAVCVPTVGDGVRRAPSYRAELLVARATCAGPAAPTGVVVPVAPGPRWTLGIPCDRLVARPRTAG